MVTPPPASPTRRGSALLAMSAGTRLLVAALGIAGIWSAIALGLA